jgi:hypothetical protein
MDMEWCYFHTAKTKDLHVKSRETVVIKIRGEVIENVDIAT